LIQIHSIRAGILLGETKGKRLMRQTDDLTAFSNWPLTIESAKGVNVSDVDAIATLLEFEKKTDATVKLIVQSLRQSLSRFPAE
jgi:hypothetical protein